MTIAEAIDQLSIQENFDYAYASDILDNNKKVEFSVENKTILQVLKLIIDNPKIKIKERNNQIIFNKNKEPSKSFIKSSQILEGVIRKDSDGSALEGAKIVEVHLKNTSTSDFKGKFSLLIDNPDQVLQLKVEAKGFHSKELRIRLNKEKHLSIKLKEILKRDTSSIQPLNSLTASLIEINAPHPSPIISIPTRLKTPTEPEDTLQKVTYNVGVLPPISTNGENAKNIINRFSLNFLFDYSAGIDGIGVSQLFNYYRFNSNGISVAGLGNYYGGNVRGIGFAGLVNIVDKNTTGFQFAGLLNSSWGSLYGMQFSGLANHIHGEAKGMQFSGIYNHVGYGGELFQFAGILNRSSSDIKFGGQFSGIANFNSGKINLGAQWAGIININGKRLNGSQIAGIINLTPDTVAGAQITTLLNVSSRLEGVQIAAFHNFTHKEAHGLQLALTNFNKELHGVQIGLLNYTKNLSGVQLGFINISDTISKGVPIGIFSFVRKGLRQAEVFFDTDDFQNIGIRTGTNWFYNMIYGGYNNEDDRSIWRIGYGVGTQHRLLKKFDVNLEYMSWRLDQEGLNDHISVLNQGKIKLHYGLTKHLGIYAGGVVNAYSTNTFNEATEKPILNIQSDPKDQIIEGD